MTPNPVSDLGSYLKDQRLQAQLSLRQAAERAGISNPYLSQIERGLKRPSAEILQAIAKGLAISAEQLYVHAGILDAPSDEDAPVDTRQAIKSDPRLSDKQRKALLDVYESYVGD
ncbi:helix-turn-helix domain-containing protein [Flexivirga caeni]|uniref:XRE family transcriptional regulator n=1 Tax=Flexivirga caeni TaxID=2294115 RepID=A0A3M9MGK8_9MICO|nr:helix-turn-helix transcriptional regulator [Flexivirga caeni]RNI23798.1 XRE family transcriptional regulator [Flexivirga caeni]